MHLHGASERCPRPRNDVANPTRDDPRFPKFTAPPDDIIEHAPEPAYGHPKRAERATLKRGGKFPPRRDPARQFGTLTAETFSAGSALLIVLQLRRAMQENKRSGIPKAEDPRFYRSNLAREAKKDANRTRTVFEALEAAGLVHKEPVPGTRKARYWLTPRGEKAASIVYDLAALIEKNDQ